MPTVVFLCVANAARSQMAEGLARARAPQGWTVYSAGSHPGRLSSRAVTVMKELGIDITKQYSKGMDEVPLETADLIVTLCAEEVCPIVPGAVKKLHWPLGDPNGAPRTDEQQLAAFRKTRDEIARRLPSLWDGKGEQQ